MENRHIKDVCEGKEYHKCLTKLLLPVGFHRAFADNKWEVFIGEL